MRVIKRFLGVPNLRRSTPFYIFMHFLPGISLLTLWRFVAEVRWLFPVSRQKERESGPILGGASQKGTSYNSG